MRREFPYGVVIAALVISPIAFLAFNNCFLGRDVPVAFRREMWKSGSSDDMYRNSSLQASDGSLRFVQPTETVVYGIVTFQVEHRYNVTGSIGDAEREILLYVRPRDASVEGDTATRTMKIVDRTIFDLPQYAIFVDSYESKLDTNIFHDGWHTVEVVYFEGGEEVEIVRAHFCFENGNEPLPEPSAVPSLPILNGATGVLLVVVISLAVSLFVRLARKKRV